MKQVLTKGKGPIGQLGLPLGLPLNPELAGFGLAVWVGFFLVAGVVVGSHAFCIDVLADSRDF